jgi:hypothetical protein
VVGLWPHENGEPFLEPHENGEPFRHSTGIVLDNVSFSTGLYNFKEIFLEFYKILKVFVVYSLSDRYQMQVSRGNISELTDLIA